LSGPHDLSTQEWESYWIGAPTVYHDGQRFWMWFSGGYTTGIGLASSPDGFHWTKENGGGPVMTGTAGQWDAGGVSHPEVISYSGALWMYYWGFSDPQHFRLGLARSLDKIHWVKSAYNVVLDTVQHSWEGTHIYRPSPVIVGDTMLLYYSAYDDDAGIIMPHIGLAKSYTVRPGDANGDGVVDVFDVVFLLTYLYEGGAAPKRTSAVDSDCDHAIDVFDILYLVKYTFAGGPEPGKCQQK
jgi:predicted GH43/DUF377 family glycosyl hydrolase